MSETRETENPGQRRCAFCDAPWSERMIAWFGPEQGCACCGGTVMGHWPIKAAPPPVPVGDLCCDACGKTLYRAPSAG